MAEPLVSIQFTREVDGRVFQDAITMTEAEFAAVTPEEIAAMQQRRLDGWLAAMVPADPTDPAPDPAPEEAPEE